MISNSWSGFYGIIKECAWRKRADNPRSFFVALKGGLLMNEQDLKQKLLRFQNPLEVPVSFGGKSLPPMWMNLSCMGALWDRACGFRL